MSMEPVVEKKTSGFVRCLRWLALGVVAMVTIVALFYAVENFRGKLAWDNYRKSAEQRGLVLDFAPQIPPEVPDDQNAASIPLIEAWFDPRLRPKGDPTLWPDLFDRATSLMASDRDKSKRHLTDLVAWQQALADADLNTKGNKKIVRRNRTPHEQAVAATNVLATLQVYDPALAQLREAMKRPHSRYPVDYNVEQPFAILLPHLANIKRLCSFLSVHAAANLAANNSDAALQDVLVALHLVDSLESEHFLINYLVQVACLQLAAQAVWEGTVQQRWTDAQWKQIQERAERLDFLRGMQHALDTERAAGITTIDWVKARQSGRRFQALGEPDALANGGINSLGFFSFAPRGWWDMEKVSYARIFEKNLAPILAGLKTGTFVDVPGELHGDGLHRGPAAVWHHEVIASLLLPALDKVHRKAGMAQALADEVVVACALERARLADGRYPQSLAALTPRFLPQPRRDVMTGQPLIYRADANGYVLYSIGWNQQDDGGRPGKTMFDDKDGDWVWQVPATAQFE